MKRPGYGLCIVWLLGIGRMMKRAPIRYADACKPRMRFKAGVQVSLRDRQVFAPPTLARWSRFAENAPYVCFR